jgi:hypothetical protein
VSMSLFLPMHQKKWENYRLILLEEVSLSEVEKNAGPLPWLDSQEFTPPNSKLVMTNYKSNSGVTISLMLKPKNGELKMLMKKENLLKELSVNSSWNQLLP